jgi:hypothetical protein
MHWSAKNPHITLDAHRQTGLQINMWCGIHGIAIVGSVFVDNFTGDRYRHHMETI